MVCVGISKRKLRLLKALGILKPVNGRISGVPYGTWEHIVNALDKEYILVVEEGEQNAR